MPEDRNLVKFGLNMEPELRQKLTDVAFIIGKRDTELACMAIDSYLNALISANQKITPLIEHLREARKELE
jgi:hypothetical protein